MIDAVFLVAGFGLLVASIVLAAIDEKEGNADDIRLAEFEEV